MPPPRGSTTANEHCDSLLAVGGGSAIDVAKCIKLFCKMDDSRCYLEQESEDTGVPIIAVPTTAGTGSEATRYAAIYFRSEKQSVIHSSLLPDHVALIPSVLATLPSYQKKCTMLDALCQGIESWWSINSTNTSIELSSKAIRLIMSNMDAYLDNSCAAFEPMMIAANLSGQAINIAQTTAAHAMSYKLSSLYKLPHGHAVALCLPQVWRVMENNPDRCADKRGEVYLSSVFSDIAYSLGCTNVNSAIVRIESVVKEAGLSLPSSANRESDIAILSNSVNMTRLANSPISISKSDFREMYERIVAE